MAVARLSGPARVLLAPGGPFLSLGRISAGQSGCWMAWMRCHAVTISSDHGQVPTI